MISHPEVLPPSKPRFYCGKWPRCLYRHLKKKKTCYFAIFISITVPICAWSFQKWTHFEHCKTKSKCLFLKLLCVVLLCSICSGIQICPECINHINLFNKMLSCCLRIVGQKSSVTQQRWMTILNCLNTFIVLMHILNIICV